MPDSNEPPDRITSQAEQAIAASLLSILDPMAIGDRVQESNELRDVLCSLEFFIPEVLSEVHSEWDYESLDGVLPLVAEKTGLRSMSIFGQCILISDQTLVPLHVELQVDTRGDKVTRFECKLGARDKDGMIRTPYHAPNAGFKLLDSLDRKTDAVDWAYVVAFGERTA